VLSGDPSLNGYQSRSRQRVLDMAEAIYSSIRELGITYINPPASFETAGQKVRLPDQVLSDGMGTCLDLTALLAAALEQAGLKPFVVIVDGHAFPGVWLDDFCLPEPAVFEPTAVRKRVDAEDAVIFDSSSATQRVDFAAATQVARSYLESNEAFHCAIDVASARKARILPLPVRLDGGQWHAAPERRPEPAASAPERRLPQLRYAEDVDDQVTPATRTRLEAWKGRLLDLSLRNRLLNVRWSLKSIVQLDVADVGALEDRLAEGGALSVHPRATDEVVLGPRSGELLARRSGEDVRAAFLKEALGHGRVHATLPPPSSASA